MRKAIILSLLLALVVSAGGCAAQMKPRSSENPNSQILNTEEQQTAVGSKSDQQTDTEQETVDKPQEDSEMEQILRELVDNNYICISTMFYYGVLPFDTSEAAEDAQYVTVQSEEFSSIEALRAFLAKTYTQSEVDRLLNRYRDGNPLYVDDGGVLKVNLSQASYAGMVAPWESYTISVVSKDDEKCIFTVDAQYPSDPLREGPNHAVYSFCAVYESGWKLSEMVFKPD